jgi:hypothetical protein
VTGKLRYLERLSTIEHQSIEHQCAPAGILAARVGVVAEVESDCMYRERVVSAILPAQTGANGVVVTHDNGKPIG